MVCPSCSIKNVEFAPNCFACGEALSTAKKRVSAELLHGPQPSSSPETSAAPSAAKRSAGGLVIRGLVALAIAWSAAGGFPRIEQAFETLLELAREAPTAPPSERAEPSEPSEPSGVTEAAPTPVAEQNGFRLTHFSLDLPEGRSGGHFHLGERVRGRSEIKGFEVNAQGELAVTITFAFRDPNGALVEPISPSVLRQKAETDTLYTDFYYDVAADATEGHYDLELGVDDAVSGRSARFHQTIPVDPPGEPS